MTILQGVIFIEVDINTRNISFLRTDTVNDYDKNTTNIYMQAIYRNSDGDKTYLSSEDIKNYVFTLYTLKPNTNNPFTINGVVTTELKEQVRGGVVKFVIPKSCTNRAGVVKCELHVTKEAESIASTRFIFNVQKSLVTVFNEQLLEDEDFPILQQLILEIQKASNINDNNTSNTTTYSSNKIENIINQKTDKTTTDNIQQQVNNLVLGAVGDGNNAEVIQARGKYDTLNDRLDDTNVYKYLEQYNLFNFEKVTNEKLNSSGYVISDDNYRLSEYINISGLNTVHITYPSNATYSVFCVFYNIDKSIIEINKFDNWTTSASFVVPSDAVYVRFSFRYADGFENLVTVSPFTLDKFYSYDDVFIKEKVIPKEKSIMMKTLDSYIKINHFNKNDVNVDFRLQDDGSIMSGQSNWITSNFIKINPSDVVNCKITNSATYGYRVCEYDKNKVFIKTTRVEDFTTKYSLNTTTETYYIKFDFKNNTGWETEVMTLLNNNLPDEFISYDCYDFKNFKHIDKEINKKIANLETITHNSNFFLPNNIYIKKDRNGKRRVRKSNVLISYNDNDFYINREESVNYNVARDYLVVNDASVGRQGLPLFLSNARTKEKQYYKLGYVNVVDGTTNPTTQKNILMIGDSFTDGGFLPCETKNILVNEMGLTNLNFIGHKEDVDDSVTCKNCGIGGFTLMDYIKTDNTQGRPESRYNNPFLFNGSISFSQYLTSNGFDNQLDYVVIECGVNDIGTLSATPDVVRDRAKELIDNIHAEFPNCKIFLVGQKYASEESDYIDAYIWNKKIMEMNRLYEELCESSSYNATCTYVDIAVMFDTEYGTPYEMKPVYKGSDETIRKITDWLHPNKCGYYMIAENIACAIASNL